MAMVHENHPYLGVTVEVQLAAFLILVQLEHLVEVFLCEVSTISILV